MGWVDFVYWALRNGLERQRTRLGSGLRRWLCAISEILITLWCVTYEKRT